MVFVEFGSSVREHLDSGCLLPEDARDDLSGGLPRS
ncbi:MAG: hypothetical protein K0S00_4502 [Xanthobacteraceae bacterium]|jgi:hypothetical protein|nr:hypothetical protein [Xanthobacteraceae bacterium]